MWLYTIFNCYNARRLFLLALLQGISFFRFLITKFKIYSWSPISLPFRKTFTFPMIHLRRNLEPTASGRCLSQCQKCRGFVSQSVRLSFIQSVTSKQYRSRWRSHTLNTHTGRRRHLQFLRASKNKSNTENANAKRPTDWVTERPIDTDTDIDQTSKTNARLPSHRYAHTPGRSTRSPKHTDTLGGTHMQTCPQNDSDILRASSSLHPRVWTDLNIVSFDARECVRGLSGLPVDICVDTCGLYSFCAGTRCPESYLYLESGHS